MIRRCVGNVEESIAGLGFGDVIQVDWLDASEVTGHFSVNDENKRGHGCFDTPIRSLGYFLGVRGKRCKHVVIAKEVIRTGSAFHYNVIPLGMIQAIQVLAKNVLEREMKRQLKKFVDVALQRRFSKKAGWIYC
jgi:hypothetical protein